MPRVDVEVKSTVATSAAFASRRRFIEIFTITIATMRRRRRRRYAESSYQPSRHLSPLPPPPLLPITSPPIEFDLIYDVAEMPSHAFATMLSPAMSRHAVQKAMLRAVYCRLRCQAPAP